MYIDFETASACDIKTRGSYVYANHPSTHLLCLAYGRTATDVSLWYPQIGTHCPIDLQLAIKAGEEIHAHNSGFERSVWEAICVPMGWPAINPKQWRCTASQCRRLTLPGSLEQAGAVAKAPLQKSQEGKDLIQRLCIPQKDGKFSKDPALLEKLYDYCRQDVQAEISLGQRLPALEPRELAIWQLDQEINQRGIQIDLEAVGHALAVVGQLKKQYNIRLAEITDYQVTAPSQLARLKAWIFQECGMVIGGMDAESIKGILKKPDVPENVKEALTLRQLGGKSSNAKLDAMRDRADRQGRVRDNLIYHGSTTGRWAGSGLQIQNFVRPKLKDYQIEAVHAVLPKRNPEAIEILVGSPIAAISSCLRSFIRAKPGHKFYCGDYSSVEARALAWLAGEEELLQQFRDGVDTYVAMASKIYDCPMDGVTDDQRFYGKSAVLGCGFSMGYKKFRMACQNAGASPTFAFCKKVIKIYRTENPKIVDLWGALNKGAVHAIKTGESVEINDKLSIHKKKGFMRISLPAGRDLYYASPRVVQVRAPWSTNYTGSIVAPEEDGEKFEGLGCELGPWENGTFEKCKGPIDSIRAIHKLGYSINFEKPKPKMIDTITYMAVDNQTKQWSVQRTYGGSLCLAAGTEVLTDNGWKAIQNVLLSDLVWDGDNWVSHYGIIDQGVQDCIDVWGIRMTPDHRMLTTKGWKDARICERLDRETVRLPDCFEVCGNAKRREILVEMRLRMWERVHPVKEEHYSDKRNGKSILRLQDRGSPKNYSFDGGYHSRVKQAPNLRSLVGHEATMQFTNMQGIQELWCAWDYLLPRMGTVRSLLGGHGVELSIRDGARPRRQRVELLQGKLQVGTPYSKPKQPTSILSCGRVDGITGRNDLRYFGTHNKIQNASGLDRTGNFGNPCRFQTFDILNAGPKKAFTVRGKDGIAAISKNCENVVQAVARDVLCDSMLRVEAAGYPIIASVHDEIVSEVPEDFGSVAEFTSLMKANESWSDGFPVDVKATSMQRYGK